MSAPTTQSTQPSQQISLVESLMQHIDAFQSGEANEMTYLSAMNALRDLHAFIKKTEKVQDTKKSAVIITIDGEEYFIESYQDKRIAIRFTDNCAYSSDTGDFLGVWDEETRSLTEIPEDEE
jgi:enterochelin esterase-like enzyme